MKKNLILMAVLILLYLGLGFSFNAVYGDSFPFFSGDNYWGPDGYGGWVKHGTPGQLMPDQPSVTVPLIFHYLPILVPAFVLMLFLFTPLSRYLETKKEEEPEEGSEEESEEEIEESD